MMAWFGCTCVLCRGEAVSSAQRLYPDMRDWDRLEREAHRAQLLKDIRAEVLEAIREAKEQGLL